MQTPLKSNRLNKRIRCIRMCSGYAQSSYDNNLLTQPDSRITSRYLRGLMGTFNERAENLMDELTKLADSKREAKMLQLVNRVTLDVITKVINPNICPPCDS